MMQKMKKIQIILLIVGVCLVGACEDTEKRTTDRTVSVSLTALSTQLSINAEDLQVPFTLALDRPLTADVALSLVLEGGKSGEDCCLDTMKYVVKAGEDEVEGEITFLASAFPKGVMKDIKLKVVPEDKQLKGEEIVFNVTGRGKTVIPATDYCIPDASYRAYAVVTGYGIGDLIGRKEYTGKEWYSDFSKTIAFVNRGDNTVYITVDQASTTLNDLYRVVMWADWNGDGNFKEKGERIFSQDWEANGVRTFAFPLTVPENAATVSRIRFGLFYKQEGKMIVDGCGKMDSGDLIDITYCISEQEIADPPVPRNVRLYCIPSVTYGAYAIVEGYKIGTLEVSGKTLQGYEGWSNRIASVAWLERGKNEVTITVDQAKTGKGDPYAIAMWVDWNGDGDFDDEGEQVISEKWKAEGKRCFTYPIQVPVNAVPSSVIRFGLYYDGEGTSIRNGCGRIDSGDLIDITYKLK